MFGCCVYVELYNVQYAWQFSWKIRIYFREVIERLRDIEDPNKTRSLNRFKSEMLKGLMVTLVITFNQE